MAGVLVGLALAMVAVGGVLVAPGFDAERAHGQIRPCEERNPCPEGTPAAEVLPGPISGPWPTVFALVVGDRVALYAVEPREAQLDRTGDEIRASYEVLQTRLSGLAPPSPRLLEQPLQLAGCTVEEPCLPEAGQLYVIRLDDTLATIAARFRTTPEELRAINPQLETQSIVQRGGIILFTEDGLLLGNYIILAAPSTALPALPSRDELVEVGVRAAGEESVAADASGSGGEPRPRSGGADADEGGDSGGNAVIALVVIGVVVLGVALLGFQISRRQDEEVF